MELRKAVVPKLALTLMAAQWFARLHVLTSASRYGGLEWLIDSGLKFLAIVTLTVWFRCATSSNRADRISKCVTRALLVSAIGDYVTQFELGAYVGILIFLVAHLFYLGVVDFGALSSRRRRIVMWILISIEIVALTTFFGGTPLGEPRWASVFLLVAYLVPSGVAIIAYCLYARVAPERSGARPLRWAAGGLGAQLVADGMLLVRHELVRGANEFTAQGRGWPALGEASIVLYHLGQCLLVASLVTVVRRFGRHESPLVRRLSDTSSASPTPAAAPELVEFAPPVGARESQLRGREHERARATPLPDVWGPRPYDCQRPSPTGPVRRIMAIIIQRIPMLGPLRKHGRFSWQRNDGGLSQRHDHRLEQLSFG
jgi:uncharacterized membrane protein YhhN